MVIGIFAGPGTIACVQRGDFAACMSETFFGGAPVQTAVSEPATDVAASVEAGGPSSDPVAIDEPDAGNDETALSVSQAVLPSFALVRVEPDGLAVIAGTASPSGEIRIFADDEQIGTETAEPSGDFVFVTETPLPAGGVELRLLDVETDRFASTSVMVVVQDDRTAEPLVVASEPGEASEILQGLEPAAPPATPDEAPAEPAVSVAAVEAPVLDAEPVEPREAVAAAEPVDQPELETVEATAPAETEPDPATPATEPEIVVAEAPREPAHQPVETAVVADAVIPEDAPADRPATAAQEPVPVAEPAETSDEPPVAAPVVAESPDQPAAPEPVVTAPSPEVVHEPVAAADPAVEQPVVPAPVTEEPAAAPVAAEEPASAAAPAESPAPEPAAQSAAVAPVAEPVQNVVAETPQVALAAPTIDAVEIDGNRNFFAGSGTNGMSVRLYVDNRAVGSTEVADGRWLVEATGVLDQENQRVRIDMLDRNGVVVGRAEVDFILDLPGTVADDIVVADAPEPPSAPVIDPQPAAATPQAAPAPDIEPAPAQTTIAVQPDPVAPAQEPTEPETVAAPAETAVPTLVGVTTGNRTTSGQAIIRRGDNLWTIARRVYGEGIRYTQIFEANADQIRDPDLIYPGQVFDLPGTDQMIGEEEDDLPA